MIYDLLVIGGGVNGAAIARDAAGRGWKVLLVEKDDLAGHTSSASSKLIHGGIRYLEYYEFGLVRKALKEREVLLHAAPHIIRPMRLVFPHNQLVRPYWMIRAGLLLYDLLAGRSSLKRTRGLGSADPRFRSPLADPNTRGFVYSDCTVDDARLVVLNAMDAAAGGAEIATRTELVSAERMGDIWQARLSDGRTVEAKAIANAAGPWVAEVLSTRLGGSSRAGLRLVRGSHIIVPRLFAGDHGYILQQPDKRVVFALPFLGKFTLIGTTDVAVGEPGEDEMDSREQDYLCAAVNQYFAARISPDDVVSHYAGVRSLYDDGAEDSMEVTRDYVLEMEEGGPLLISVFGGKITTARALAEDAMDRLIERTGSGQKAWTRGATLPGGDIGGDFDAFVETVEADYPFLDWENARRMAHAYGSLLPELIGDAKDRTDLGEDFGAGLTEREVRWLVEREWARTPEDILWRRSKLGLLIDEAGQARLAAWLEEHAA